MSPFLLGFYLDKSGFKSVKRSAGDVPMSPRGRIVK